MEQTITRPYQTDIGNLYADLDATRLVAQQLYQQSLERVLTFGGQVQVGDITLAGDPLRERVERREWLTVYSYTVTATYPLSVKGMGEAIEAFLHDTQMDSPLLMEVAHGR